MIEDRTAGGAPAPGETRKVDSPYAFKGEIEIGGNCPVIGDGNVDGHRLHFSARGARWEAWIGEGPDRSVLWKHEEAWGVWPAAGWMTQEEAFGLIMKACEQHAKDPAAGHALALADPETWEDIDDLAAGWAKLGDMIAAKRAGTAQ